MRTSLAAALMLLVIAACGSSGDPVDRSADAPSTSGSSPSGPPTPEAPPNPLVGEWERLTTCQDRVRAFEQAGLRRYAAKAVVEDGYVPGVTDVRQLEDPEHPCTDAVARRHFFTADGLFGSADENHQQVDDGSYRMIDAQTFAIGHVRFHFRIVHHDVLRLRPVLPACAERGCFDAQWAVSVTHNGLPWHRIR